MSYTTKSNIEDLMTSLQYYIIVSNSTNGFIKNQNVIWEDIKQTTYFDSAMPLSPKFMTILK